jgi:enterochelin esterase family protein
MMRAAPLSLFLLSSSLLAQAPPVPPIKSPVVNADHSLTFRLIAPAATQAGVALDLYAKPLPMTKGDDGVWSVTTKPLDPEYYGYDYVVDGKTQLDPLNADVRFNYVFLGNQVMLPGATPQPWELQAVPHGRVTHVRFTTHVAKGLPDNQSAYVVYTPPGYDEQKPGGYPVLYLLHGWSDNETAWTSIGRADMVLDALIAQHKAVPMIVVMPLGYGDLSFVEHGFSIWNKPEPVDSNTRLFSQELLTEVMPAVEHDYNVAKGRDNRAIAGLSMGGLETLSIGLNNTDKFAYVAGMSAAIHLEHFDERMAGVATADAAKKAKLKLLWVGCGTEDGLLKPNEDFIAWAKAKGLDPVASTTPFGHVWLAWRANLVEIAPLLFRPK